MKRDIVVAIAVALALAISACVDTGSDRNRTERTEQGLCTEEDQQNGCDPAGGWQALRQYLSAWASANYPGVAYAGESCHSYRDAYSNVHVVCTASLNFGGWTVNVTCEQVEDEEPACTSSIEE